MWLRPSVLLLLLAALFASANLSGQNKYEDLYLSGYVLFRDGAPPNEPVKVELTCRGQIQQLSYSRADGYLSFKAGLKGTTAQTFAQKFSDRYHYNLAACQLSASLSGFTSEPSRRYGQALSESRLRSLRAHSRSCDTTRY